MSKNFNNFLEENMTFIESTTEVNPTISLKDEWTKEDCWSKDYRELKKQRRTIWNK